MNEIISALKEKLTTAVRGNKAEALLFSGGLDSSILAVVDPGMKAITVSLESSGEDMRYSGAIAGFLGLDHIQKRVDTEEAIEVIPDLIKILKSFDPALPNDLAVYFGFKHAMEAGVTRIATGDGSDELFGGYSFMSGISDLGSYIRQIVRTMNFSSNKIGRFLGLEVAQPYIDREVVDLALAIPTGLKIKEESGKLHGKWILRKAFQGILPEGAIWQDKRPLECGSGMTKLRSIISDRVTDEEFKAAPAHIKFLGKEHFYYYKIYCKVVGDIPQAVLGEKKCPSCGAGISANGFHCGICGYVMDWKLEGAAER